MPAQKKTTKKTAARKPKAAPAKPIRRELGALSAFLLSVLSFLVLFGTDALVINWLRTGLTALIGRGIFLLPFALLGAAFLLVFHRGRPVMARVIAALLTPVLLGALLHVFLSKDSYRGGWAFFGDIIKGGVDKTGGGLVSGTLAHLLAAGISRAGAAIVLIVIFIALLLIVFQYSIVKMIDDFRTWRAQRPAYEPEPEPVRTEPVPRSQPAPKRSKRDIDVPLYLTEEQLSGEYPPKPNGKLGSKSGRVKTPAEALLEPPDPVPLPQVFHYDGQVTYIDPATGEVLEAHPEDAPVSAPLPKAVSVPETMPTLEPEPVPGPEAAPMVPESLPIRDYRPALTASEPAAEETPPFDLADPPAGSEAPVSAAVKPPRYEFPRTDLLELPKPLRDLDSTEELRMGAARLVEVLDGFGLNVQIINVTRGPSVARYELEMETGMKLSRLTNLATDIALAMGTESVNISPIPHKMSVVGIEIPNKITTMVTLREVVESGEFTRRESATTFAIGKDIGGRCIVADIAKMPHLLVAGSTGSGKSVCVNSLIVSLMYKASPDDLKLILIDPKKVEFPPYNGIPHLLVPVITDSNKAASTLEWAVLEMEKRYTTLADCGKRDIDGYNSAFGREDPEHPYMCRIVIIIDEMADLIMESRKERNMENFIVRIAQKARACGIHLVLATQRPDAKVITGLIKANVPSRIALKVSDPINSRIVIDQPGAERLIGNGDMLFVPTGQPKPLRVQGCYVSEREIHRIVDSIKQSCQAQYAEDVMERIDKGPASGSGSPGGGSGEDEADPMLPAAIETVIEAGQASVTFLQRRLKLGYARAARLMDLIVERGIVSEAEGAKPRKVLVTREQWEEMKTIDN